MLNKSYLIQFFKSSVYFGLFPRYLFLKLGTNDVKILYDTANLHFTNAFYEFCFLSIKSNNHFKQSFKIHKILSDKQNYLEINFTRTNTHHSGLDLLGLVGPKRKYS